MITVDTSIGQILQEPNLQPYAKYLMYRPSEKDRATIQRSASAVARTASAEAEAGNSWYYTQRLSETAASGWSPQGIADGLNFFIEKLEKYEVEQYFIYSRMQCDEPLKRDVNIIRLKPDVIDPTKPTILICGGGGYKAVDSIADALPTARHFVEGGYQAYILTYRVGANSVPKTIEDLNETIIYMAKHSGILSFNPEKLVLVGFDAGANLICNWSLPHVGYKAHNIPKPLAIVPVYPVTDLKTELILHRMDGILGNMFGSDFAANLIKYNIIDYIDENFPSAYWVCGKNDSIYPPRNSEVIYSRMTELNLLTMLDEALVASHGFGDGTGTMIKGWPERCMDFISLL